MSMLKNNKKAIEWTMSKVATIILLLILVVWVIFWYSGLGRKMVEIITSIFG